MSEIMRRAMEAKQLLIEERKKRGTSKQGEYFDWLIRDEAKLRRAFPDITIMGVGSESLVIENPEDPETVLTLGFDKRKRYGVLPFAETYHLHKILNCLYPDDFTQVFKIAGFGLREAKKEKINGHKLTTDEVFEAEDKSNELEQEMEQAGIKICIDSFYLNYINSNSGLKNVDFVEGGAKGSANADRKKLLEIFERNNNRLDPELKKVRYRQLITSLGRLHEIDLINRLFQKMVKTNNFTIDEKEIRAGLTHGEGDRSVARIRKLLDKAVDAVKTRGYKYDERWLDL